MRADRSILNLVAITLPEIKRLRDLSQVESREYLDSVRILESHSQAATLIEIVRLNLAEFVKARSDFGRKIPEVGKRGKLRREASLELNRLFLNFLSAFRQFLDHNETRLKRTFTDQSEIFKAFRNCTPKAFDSALGYRFLYKLRNFGQHCGAPIGFVDFESRAVGSGGLTLHTLHVKFDPVRLLKDGEDLWGPVKSDLLRMKAPFDVEALHKQCMIELEDVWAEICSREREVLQNAADTLVAIVSDVPSGAIPAVMQIRGEKTLSFVLPPFDTMEWLGIMRFRSFI